MQSLLGAALAHKNRDVDRIETGWAEVAGTDNVVIPDVVF